MLVVLIVHSAHNQAWGECEALLKQKLHIETFLNKMSDQVRAEYRTRLGVSIDCTRFLLWQGLAFRGHDEADVSKNQSNFLNYCDGCATITRILKPRH
ncbi:hypothetical protein IC582_016522 [Cucumis melo]